MADAPNRNRPPKRRGAPQRKAGRGGSGPQLTSARKMAVEVTREARQRDAYIRELIDARREGNELPREEFDYAQVLCFGVSMCRGVLDWFIDRNLNSPSDIKDNVRDCLRISAYELLYLQKPHHVVVSQGVELVRYVAAKAAGLGNAVLRKMCADAKGFPWPQEGGEPAAFARRFGMPQWLCRAFSEQMGPEVAEQVLEACLLPAPTYTVPNPWNPGTRFASDLAAQQAASAVPLEGSILEVGAGRGTKTMLLQSRAKAQLDAAAQIHTLDIHEYKAGLLRERLDAMKVPGVSIHTGDACKLDEVEGLPPCFDTVFVDAPCSGTGTLRRHPEIRWNLEPQDVEALASLQLEMLRSCAQRVAPGGALVYATCSVLKQENEDVVAAFLGSPEGEGFAVEPVAPAFDEFQQSVTEEGFFSSLPSAKGPDGHFCALLRNRKG